MSACGRGLATSKFKTPDETSPSVFLREIELSRSKDRVPGSRNKQFHASILIVQ